MNKKVMLSKDENDIEKMYTVKDIEEIFQISHCTANKLVNSRGFPKITINRRHYIPAIKLQKWIDQNTDKRLEI